MFQLRIEDFIFKRTWYLKVLNVKSFPEVLNAICLMYPSVGFLCKSFRRKQVYPLKEFFEIKC